MSLSHGPEIGQRKDMLRRRPPRPLTTSGSSIEAIEPPFPLAVPLELRRHSRARRISLRIDNTGDKVVLTAPPWAASSRALDFLRRHEGWLQSRLAKIPPGRPFMHGVNIPVMGVSHRIVSDPTTLRGRVERHDGILAVPGAREHLARRLTDYLKEEARREIGARARAKATKIGRRIKSVTLRDTTSRWGSCNHAGRLSFSWRLILAPEYVLDYIVAHEVAHLVEFNHSPRFWAIVEELHPGCRQARKALSDWGALLG